MALARSASLAFLAHAARAERPAAASYVVAGRLDLAAIMREAVKLARQVHDRHSFSWARRMAIGLRTVWGRAKAAKASHRLLATKVATWCAPARPAPVRVAPAPALAPRARVSLQGGRLHSHGW